MANKSILVVGGGIAGITAAVEAAEVGYEVFLVEKNAYLGGKVSQINEYFPKLCPPNCGLEINFQRIKRTPILELSPWLKWKISPARKVTLMLLLRLTHAIPQKVVPAVASVRKYVLWKGLMTLTLV
ncbi:hypothetical protein N752_17025 [Desulforamulus aquiferis]|nr:hypothetical protein N752_17025 [Desulforamulus aquiferis]